MVDIREQLGVGSLFHHVVPEDQTQVFKLGDRHLVLEPGGPFKRPGGWLI